MKKFFIIPLLGILFFSCASHQELPDSNPPIIEYSQAAFTAENIRLLGLDEDELDGSKASINKGISLVTDDGHQLEYGNHVLYTKTKELDANSVGTVDASSYRDAESAPGFATLLFVRKGDSIATKDNSVQYSFERVYDTDDQLVYVGKNDLSDYEARALIRQMNVSKLLFEKDTELIYKTDPSGQKKYLIRQEDQTLKFIYPKTSTANPYVDKYRWARVKFDALPTDYQQDTSIAIDQDGYAVTAKGNYFVYEGVSGEYFHVTPEKSKVYLNILRYRSGVIQNNIGAEKWD